MKRTENNSEKMKHWRERWELKKAIDQKSREVTSLRKILHEKEYPTRAPYFSDILRKQILERKRFRKPDGTVFEASELELIANKVIKELRTATPVNTRLLEVVLDRLEGKVKERVELSGADGGAIKYAHELTDEQLEQIAYSAFSGSEGATE